MSQFVISMIGFGAAIALIGLLLAALMFDKAVIALSQNED